MSRIVLAMADYETAAAPRGMRHAGPAEVDRIYAEAKRRITKTRKPGTESRARSVRIMAKFITLLADAGIFVEGA